MKTIPYQLLVVITVFILLFACNTNNKTLSKTAHVTSWMKAINGNTIESVYLPGSIKIVNQKAIFGIINIQNYYNSNPLNLIGDRSIFQIPALNDSSIVYEIGQCTSDKNQPLQYIIINKKVDDKFLRELELIEPYKHNPDSSIKTQIDARRVDWVSFCANKDAAGLVNKVYAENAIYYNHKPPLTGREAISKEYQYMNNPTYNLNLKPLHIEVVNETTVFEIGQGIGSYEGKYIIIWKKDLRDGIWYVAMDSNI